MPGQSPFAHESEELRRALDEGDGTPMPDNIAPGILGERPVDIRKTESYHYPSNAGLVQENTSAVRWMFILILYLLVITGPVAVWLLWRDRTWTTRHKWVWTAIMLFGYVVALWWLTGATSL